MELHLVHAKAIPEQEDDFGVVGIFFDREAGGDAHNEFIAALNVAKMHNKDRYSIKEVPLFEELTSQLDFNRVFHYKGSLTTPPCTEEVTWIILNEPQHISTAQVEEI